MANRKFLEQVVDYYLNRPGSDISDVTFVLPNKRSAMFLKKYIQDRAAGPMFMPRITTLGRLVERLSPLPLADRQEQIFTLYECYGRVLAEMGHQGQLKDFDRFLFWGEIVLTDFDDTDRALANPRELFANLRNYKGIMSDFLEPEQKELVRAIWGDNRLTAERENFWLHVPHDDDGEDSMAARFISLWEVLGPLYQEFHKDLEARGLTTAGRQLRRAAERLRAMVPDEIPFGTVSFVGFSELSAAETALLSRLKDAGKADFFWDVASDLLYGPDGKFDATASEARRMKRLTAEFPMPEGFTPDVPTEPIDVEIIGVSSEVAQTKMIEPLLAEWFADGAPEPGELLNTAIVLADEGLLLPTLSSLPESLPLVNITMGLPYMSTPFAALLRSVISMQLRMRRIGGRPHFYYEDVRQVLSNPYFQTIAPAECDRVRQWLSTSKVYNLPVDELAAEFPALAYLFRSAGDPNSVDDVHRYTSELVRGLHEALSKVRIDDAAAELLEVRVLERFADEIDTLGQRIRSHGIAMNQSTYFHLFERLLASVKINLTGKPLQGLQIMGMLETRVLDFDRVAILSMNERVMPRRNLLKTLIPMSLRAAFMLPTADDYESDYAYHFGRLLSRAKSVRLLYDSRSAAKKRTGEMSRYLTRLLHNPAGSRIRVSRTQVSMPSSVAEQLPLKVEKSQQVMDELREFLPGGKLKLSASAIKTYKKCPLQFYLQYVRSLRSDNDPADYIDESGYGTIVHCVVEELYKPFTGKEITRDTLEDMMRDDVLRPIVRRVVAKHYMGKKADSASDEVIADIPPEGTVMAGVVEHLVRRMLQYEVEAFCSPSFTFVDAEAKAPAKVWRLDNGLEVNFKMSIDRIDSVRPGLLRFIDYKTGADPITTKFDNLFTPGHEGDAILQLLIYCEAWLAMSGQETDIVPYVYPFRLMSANGGIVPSKLDGEELLSYRAVADRFRPAIADLIAGIFDPKVPFGQCEDAKHCVYCPFLQMCGRNPSKY